MSKSNDEVYMVPQRQMIRACRQYPKLLKLADLTGQELDGISTLLRVLVVKRLLRKILGPDEKNVGVLFPTSVYGVVVNAALSLDRRVVVNLNYTFGPETLNYCVKKAEIRHVLTTKRFIERFPDLKLDAEIVVLEDAVQKLTVFDKLLAWVDTYITPASVLDWKYDLLSIDPDEMMTIVFSSGSTGEPKGVMLSHNNISSNVAGFIDHLRVDEKVRICGILPLFHGFGYSTTVWLPLMTGVSGVYHFNPLDPKKVGELCRKYRPVALPSTATFQRNYLRRCPKEDFEHVPTIPCGAEKLPRDLAEAWKNKYGQTMTEGYGTTELSPVVSANIDSTRRPDYQDWYRPGSVGRTLFNVQVRVVDLETGEVLPPNTPGMLQVKGPNVMLGYYKEPEMTAKVLKDGWYTTGDLAKIDEDGFIWITGRETRMSKIGGEMVPHIMIEESIGKVILPETEADTDAEEGIAYAVAGVPDPTKGEKLVVLYKTLPVSPEEICKRLQKEGIPNLWIPSPQNFRQIEGLPLLGTGKLDLRATKELALKLFEQR